MKNVILLFLTGIALFAQSQNPFKTEDVKLLPHDVKIKDYRYLKLHQEEIKDIINEFNVLLNKLKGYEEYYLVKDIRDLFIKRYYIEEGDSIKIDRNLNKILDKKIKQQLKVLESK